MPNPTIRIHNAETNETIDREMTEKEFAQYELDVEANTEKANLATSNAEAKAALLDRLGITAEEAALLLG